MKKRNRLYLFLAGLFPLVEPAYASVPNRDDWHEGTGLLQIIIIICGVFILLIPVSLMMGLKRKDSLGHSFQRAYEWAIKGTIVGFVVVLPLALIALAIPFGILNMVGLSLFGRQCYLPLMIPGMLVALGGYFYLWKKHFHGNKTV